MTRKEEIEEIKTIVNQLFVQLTIVSAKNAVLESLVLDGIVKEKMPQNSNCIYSNYVDELENLLNNRMDEVEDCLFETNDHAFLLRQKFEIMSMISSMRRDDRYEASNG